jgi:Undecaprenyl-phosphate galactose phosphotransferase WbaP
LGRAKIKTMSTFTTTQQTSAYDLVDPVIQDPHRPGLSAMLVFTADILGLSLILWVFVGKTIMGRYAASGESLLLWQLLSLFLVLYWLFGSYPGVSVNPVPEIRRISLANASAFLFISVILAVHHEALISQLVCLLACVGSSIVILTMRALIRKVGSRFDWWGYPVVLIGAGTVALSVLHKLISQPHLGLRPVAVVADQVAGWEIEGIPVFPSECLGQIASSGVKHAIVAAPELSQSEFVDVIEQGGDIFPHLILIPDTDYIWKVESYTRDLMGILGIQVRNNLLDGGSQIVKRTIDLASSILLTLFFFPVMVIIALMILLESGFPVFYFQKRLGHGGRIFHMWKFRTMMQDNAMVLEQCLANNSAQRKEWAEFQKLRNDPRVTHVGRLLRRTSLDELPQLWNIIKGDMSLVGPRPYLDSQLAKYRAAYSVYVKTTPGLTGLWQVSGRNRTTLTERIAYDVYYIRNWSVWMDIYLLAKTVGTVLSGDGAY